MDVYCDMPNEKCALGLYSVFGVTGAGKVSPLFCLRTTETIESIMAS